MADDFYQLSCGGIQHHAFSRWLRLCSCADVLCTVHDLYLGGLVAAWLRRWTCNPQVASSIPSPALSSNNLGQSCLHPRASAGRSGLAMA